MAKFLELYGLHRSVKKALRVREKKQDNLAYLTIRYGKRSADGHVTNCARFGTSSNKAIKLCIQGIMMPNHLNENCNSIVFFFNGI